MTTAQVIDLIEQFRVLGATRLGLSGGEPLLRDDLGEIASRFSAAGMFVSLNTNGSLLPERIEELRGVGLITVSLDGPEEVHDGLRGRGSFRRMTDGVLAAKSAGKTVAAICVLTSKNLSHIRETMEIARRIGVTVFVQPVTRCDVSGDLDEGLLPDPEPLRDTIRWLVENKSRLPLGSSRAALRLLLAYPRLDTRRICQAGRSFVYLTPEGCLTPCHVHFHGAMPSALSEGAEQALERLRRPDCQGCAVSPYLESSLIAHWNPESIWNAYRLIR